jgi:hypothetical protein
MIEQMFESGRIIVSTGDVKALEINLENKKIAVDVEDKNFIKRLIRMRGEIGEMFQGVGEGSGEGKKSGGTFGALRNVAETLNDAGVTLTVSYKGDVVVTLGAEASPTLLQLMTGTRAVAINSLSKLLRMIR